MLKQFFSELDSDKVLITTKAHRVSASNFQNLTISAKFQANNSKIVFYCKDIVLVIRNLVVLEGVADSILLLSESMPLQMVRQLSRQFGAEFILTDIVSGSIEKDLLTVSDFTSEISLDNTQSVSINRQTRWVLTTSGTTGTPKMVSHTLDSLTRTTKKDVRLGTNASWGLLYDYSRFAGMQVMLQALLTGSNLLVPDMDDDIQRKIEHFIYNNVTHLSATPTIWRKLFMSDKIMDLKLQQITMGGEIADQKVLNTAKKLFPHARVTHIYASTEAGVGFSVNDGKAGFPDEYLESTTSGIELRVDDGRLMVRNSEALQHYEGSSQALADEYGWINTGDRVTHKNDRVYFLGRASGIINVGGENVYPEEVENAILEYDGIVHARVFGKNNPFTGQVVMAEVVVSPQLPSGNELKNELLIYLQKKLTASKVPALIHIVEAMNENASGKISRE